MSHRTRYSKHYISLTEEDTGFRLSGTPKGLARFETNNDQCSFSLRTEYLKPPADGYTYDCYFIASRPARFKFISMGSIEITNDKGKLSSSFSPWDVNNSGLSLEDFNVIAVVCKPENIEYDKRVIVPLVGYRHGKVGWREEFESSIQPKDAEDVKVNEDITSQDKNPENSQTRPGSKPEYDYASQIPVDIPILSGFGATNFDKPEDFRPEKQWGHSAESFDMHYPLQYSGSSTLIEHHPVYFPFTIERIKKLENLLSMSFSECKPFFAAGDSTRWWKVKNHQLLKRILHTSGYPNLMLASSYLNTSYYVYGYYIVGIDYCTGSYRFAYGIPSLYGIDPKPGGIACIWRSEGNNGELYGEFGYWILKIDMVSANTG
ncbi:hypothetical protein [Lutispora sp.]|uniref:hypothetical protein n=1 Tax=Lutispora sp. TaxID=2828727 RepID=UPI003562203E